MSCEHRRVVHKPNGDLHCLACGERIAEDPPSPLGPGYGALVSIDAARNVALARHIGRPLNPMETFLVAQARGESVDGDVNPIEYPIDEEGELQLAAAFEAFRGAPSLPRAKDDKQRRKIGEAIARYLLGARDSDSADQAARRVVAALGTDEALAVADTFVRWGQAIAAWADKAAEKGHRR